MNVYRQGVSIVLCLLLNSCEASVEPADSVDDSLALSSVASAESVLAATWGSAGSMVYGRARHTSTLLLDGKVLAAGGEITYSPTNTTASAEIFDPATTKWSTTRSMSANRYFHSATLLLDGRVLVAGGGTLSSAEVFQPTTATWSDVGAMGSARQGHSATLLPSGEVLVTGGEDFNSYTYLATAELFDPQTGVWNATGSLATDRRNHTATLLKDGRVLVAGGERSVGGYRSFVSSAEIYNPVTGTWASTGSMTSARAGHTATLLASGKVLVTGGQKGFNSADYLSSAEIYDPSVGTWASVTNMPGQRAFHTATLLSSSRVLITGGLSGQNTGGNLSPAVSTSAVVFTEATSSWESAGSMTYSRQAHTATLLASGKVLVAGGNYTYYLPPQWSTRNATELLSSDVPADCVVCQGDGICTTLNTGAWCALCSTCASTGACSDTPSDDSACGILDCDLRDSGCRDYSDIQTNRCESVGKCKKANTSSTCTVFSDLPAGTSCGVCSQCDGTGACSVMPTDDSVCPVLNCDLLDQTCRNYQNVSTNRCATLGNCKTVDPLWCTDFSNAAFGTACGVSDTSINTWSEDFQSGTASQWTVTGNLAVTSMVSEWARSCCKALYAQYASGTATIKNTFDLVYAEKPSLSFWVRTSSETIVAISTDGGVTWTTVWQEYGADSWVNPSIALDDYIGRKINVRFSVSGWSGWALDDVSLSGLSVRRPCKACNGEGSCSGTPAEGKACGAQPNTWLEEFNPSSASSWTLEPEWTMSGGKLLSCVDSDLCASGMNWRHFATYKGSLDFTVAANPSLSTVWTVIDPPHFISAYGVELSTDGVHWEQRSIDSYVGEPAVFIRLFIIPQYNTYMQDYRTAVDLIRIDGINPPCRTCDGNASCSGMPEDDPACGTIDCDAMDTVCRNFSDLTSSRCQASGSCKTANVSATCTIYTDSAAGKKCDLCKTCDGDGTCALQPVDDSACGAIDCDGLDTTCRNYADLTSARCDSLGKCKSPNVAASCTAFTDTEAGQSCGLCKSCDGTGGCLQTPDDDASCGSLDCSSFDSACRTYPPATEHRCLNLGRCKTANTTATCVTFTPSQSGTKCGTCKTCGSVGDCDEMPADDSSCPSTINCNSLDTTCRDYQSVTLTGPRCINFGKCKGVPDACTAFTDAEFGTQCGYAYCEGTVLYRADMCGTGETSGECNDGGSLDCAPFKCAGGACLSTCANAATDCGTGAYCDADGKCQWKKGEGAPCDGADQCQKAFCVDGVCCNTACSGVCASCIIEGAVGTCKPVPAGSDPEGECFTAGSCGGTCNGMGACTAADIGDPCGTCKICNSSGKCVPVSDGTSCEGTWFCVNGETCKSGLCTGGTASDCSDGNACTSDSCNESVKQCFYTPVGDGTLCSDGDACNGEETCLDGACLLGTGPECDDNNPCTEDGCDIAAGECTHEAIKEGTSCSDEDACNGNEVCTGGTCLSGAPIVCDDANGCTVDSCDKDLGCLNEPVIDGAGCLDDGNPCTADSCESGQCTHSPVENGSPCSAIGACLAACLGGVCTGGLNCDDGNPCTIDTCETAGCGHALVRDGDGCADGDICNGDETCDQGTCKAGPPISCDDSNPCTQDSCDSENGCQHDNFAETTPCSSATTCGGHCQAGECVGGVAVNCDDANACTTDSCDPATRTCVNLAQEDGVACDDGDACTTGTSCSVGTCGAGKAVNCDDANICTDDSCDPKSGCAHVPNTAACDDGDPCTSNDECSAGICSGTPDRGCEADGSSPGDETSGPEDATSMTDQGLVSDTRGEGDEVTDVRIQADTVVTPEIPGTGSGGSSGGCSAVAGRDGELPGIGVLFLLLCAAFCIRFARLGRERGWRV